MFRFFLAHQLKRTIDDIELMTLDEFTAWQAYFDLITPTPAEEKKP